MASLLSSYSHSKDDALKKSLQESSPKELNLTSKKGSKLHSERTRSNFGDQGLQSTQKTSKSSKRFYNQPQLEESKGLEGRKNVMEMNREPNIVKAFYGLRRIEFINREWRGQ